MYINHVIRGCGFAAAMCLCIGGSFAQSARTTADEDAAITLVVEELEAGLGAAAAGLEPGDVLEAWRRPTPEESGSAWVSFTSPFDIQMIDLVESPRGPVLLRGRRGEEVVEFELPPGWVGLAARPLFDLALEAKYLTVMDAVGDDPTAQLEGLDDFAAMLAAAGKPVDAAWVVVRAAMVAGRSGDPDSALRIVESARRWLEPCARRACTEALAWSLDGAAEIAKNGGRLDDADRLNQECLELRRELYGEGLEAAASLIDLGNIAARRGDYQSSEDHYREALAIRERVAPGSSVIADGLFTLGGTLTQMGDLEGAENALQRALEIQRELMPGSLALADTLTNLGILSYKQGDLEAGEGYFKQELEIRERLTPNSVSLAHALNNLGAMAMVRQDYAAAEIYLKRSLDLFMELSPKHYVVAALLGNLGFVALGRGDLEQAADYFEGARVRFEELAPSGQHVAMILTNLGSVATKRGDLAGAEQNFRQAVELLRRPGNDATQAAAVLNNLGDVALKRGDYRAANDYVSEALSISEQVRPGSLESSQYLNTLGIVALEAGEVENALSHLESALAIRRKEVPDSLQVAETLNLVGEAKLELTDLEGAAQNMARALEIRELQAPGSLAVADSHSSQGWLAIRQGDYRRALSLYRQALDIRRELAPASPKVAASLYELARATRSLGAADEALGYLEEALDVLEQQYGRIGGTASSRATFRAQFADVAREAVELLADAGRGDEAFRVVERWRARELATMLAERELVFAELPGDLDTERRVLSVEYDRRQEQIADLSPQADKEEVEELLAELRSLRRRQEEIREEVRKASPRLAALTQPEPLDVDGVRRALDPGTVLLSYAVGEERSHLFIVSAVADAKKSFEVVELEPGAAELDADVQRYRELLVLADPETKAAVDEASTALYTSLLGPAQGRLEQAARILISPDGPLHLLPFAALVREDGQHLVEWKPLHTVTSASVYARLRQPMSETKLDTGKLLVAFGDPEYLAGHVTETRDEGGESLRSIVLRGGEPAPLPASRQEVEDLAALWGETSMVFLGSDATEEQAKAVGVDADVVHFACHGVVDERMPLDSALVLSRPERKGGGGENGLLQAWEIIEQLRLDADLVVLSACDTGLGREIRGEGLIGLTRAFHYAGARSVVASLWAVPDASTAVLMRRFHEGLMAGLSKDEALRRAQVSLIREPIEVPDGQGGSVTIDASHPYAWAGFQLYGDWR